MHEVVLFIIKRSPACRGDVFVAGCRAGLQARHQGGQTEMRSRRSQCGRQEARRAAGVAGGSGSGNGSGGHVPPHVIDWSPQPSCPLCKQPKAANNTSSQRSPAPHKRCRGRCEAPLGAWRCRQRLPRCSGAAQCRRPAQTSWRLRDWVLAWWVAASEGQEPSVAWVRQLPQAAKHFG